MSKKSKFALGALLGAVAGLIAGVLTAPKSGKDTRSDIKKKANELKANAEVKVDKAKRDVDLKKAELEAEARDLKARAEHALDVAKKGFEKKNK